MRRTPTRLAEILAAAACVLLSATASQADEAAIAQGRGIAEANCARCHAIGAEGGSPHPDAPPFRTLHERYPVENLEEALAEGIMTGHPDMPEFIFSPEEIDAFIQYLKSLEKP